MTTRQARLTGSVVRYVILTLLALMIVVPILWMISTSFKTEPQTYEPKPSWIPDPFSLVAYEKFFRTYSFGRMLLNRERSRYSHSCFSRRCSLPSCSSSHSMRCFRRSI